MKGEGGREEIMEEIGHRRKRGYGREEGRW